MEAYSDSDYADANLDKKSTTGGYQFLGKRLISWQCKKQTIVATSTTELNINEALAIPEQTTTGKETLNPLMADSLPKTILLTSIKQFWSTAKVKTVNDEVRVQALIDGKKVTIKESSIRCTLRLDDEEAVEEVGEAQYDVSIHTEPSTLKPHKKYKSKKQQPKEPKVTSPASSPEHQLPSPLTDPIPTAKDSLTLQELIDLLLRIIQIGEDDNRYG
nr:putative ribonuclease H-like domain-containing protein [Tanacetum cinerariifolium]